MTPTVLTRLVARMLLAPSLVFAAALLVKGYVDVGDGFAAGVVAALVVLLQALAFGHEALARLLPAAAALRLAVGGLAVAVVVAVVPALRGGSILQHTPGPGASVVKVGTLELITAVAFDVGIFLLVLGAVVAIVGGLAHERVQEGPR